MSRLLAACVLLCVLACSKPPAPRPDPPDPNAPPLPNTGLVTIHVKGMTKTLKLT